MSEKLKPTPGPWVVGGSDTDDWAFPTHDGKDSTSAQEIVCDGDVIAFAVVAYDGWSHPRKEARLSDNATLIAEAGTVFHECGLSPRELLDGYRELLSFVEGLCATQDAPACVVQACGYMVRTAALAKHKQL